MLSHSNEFASRPAKPNATREPQIHALKIHAT
jgi:hypothetical protein